VNWILCSNSSAIWIVSCRVVSVALLDNGFLKPKQNRFNYYSLKNDPNYGKVLYHSMEVIGLLINSFQILLILWIRTYEALVSAIKCG
jgi:hypothetical protein